MKTQNNKLKLDFRKKSIIELTDQETYAVKGGTSFLCSNCMTVTIPITIK
ncbi:class I lanthipeptide [uncultured Lacinutrix sp.]|nr:class I lanthipeptide [uncultured Lacinutrix sp.]